MPSKIKLLPEKVANQIAAGEVVDRPASVIKELAENSLDAGAMELTFEVEQGGKRLVRVIDDGEGMGRDDALMCLEPHATSKITTSSDLFSISTLGFRGEALPSIASVSKMTIVTRERDADTATMVQADGGEVRSVMEVGAPAGTDIKVERLFFNVPARKKFLKSVETELSHITTFVSNMALARPDVHVRLIHNGRQVYDFPASSDLSGRLRHALGGDASSRLVPVERTVRAGGQLGEIRLHGFVSTPSYTRASTRSLHLFVNRRFVRDRLVNHAVFEAYRGLVPKGRYPLVVLFVDLPPEAVDVNVHPAKHEIRFREQHQVHEAVVETIKEALRSADRAGTRPPASAQKYGRGGPPNDPELTRGVAEAMGRFERRTERGLFDGERDERRWTGKTASRSTGPSRTIVPDKIDAVSPPGETISEGRASAPGPDPVSFSELRVIGQFGRSYILAESDDALFIIDQHAAHERVMFERIRRDYLESQVARQPLLFPETVEMTREEARRVEERADTLFRLGFEVEPFGGATVAVKALPAVLSGTDPRKLLTEVADRLDDVRGEEAVLEELDEVFALMACHSVVRAHRTLSREEIRALLDEMDSPEFPGHCPHGRDVVVRVELNDLEKWFGR